MYICILILLYSNVYGMNYQQKTKNGHKGDHTLLFVFRADDSIFAYSSLQILKLSHIQFLANTFVITTVALPMRFCDV